MRSECPLVCGRRADWLRTAGTLRTPELRVTVGARRTALRDRSELLRPTDGAERLVPVDGRITEGRRVIERDGRRTRSAELRLMLLLAREREIDRLRDGERLIDRARDGDRGIDRALDREIDRADDREAPRDIDFDTRLRDAPRFGPAAHASTVGSASKTTAASVTKVRADR